MTLNLQTYQIALNRKAGSELDLGPGTSQLSTSEQSLAGRVGQHHHLFMRNTISLTRDCEEGCQWDIANYQI